RAWVAMMKASIARIGANFNTHRMVKEYGTRIYLPAVERSMSLAAEDLAGARELARWKARVRAAWKDVRVVSVTERSSRELQVGSELVVEAEVHLGALSPRDVVVEIYHGPLERSRDLVKGEAVPMKLEGEAGDGRWRFVGAIAC